MRSISFIFNASIIGVIAAGLILLIWWPSAEDETATIPFSPPEASSTAPRDPAGAAPVIVDSGPYSYATAVDHASSSVVNIYTTRIVQQKQNPGNPLLERFFGIPPKPRNRTESGLGSGVIFSDNGYILTNYHVVHGAQDVHVSLKDGRDFAARFIGADPETDLAILRIDAEGLNGITLGHSDHLRVGDVVLAIGNPFGVGQTVTMGIISATGRDRLGLNTFENFIQTDAAINPGNSGGALVNAKGELIGINTAIFSQNGGYQGIGFAIPVDMARTVLEQIVQNGSVIRGWLGVEARDLPVHLQQQLPTKGIVVAGVFRNGPADLAGLQRGDVITEINQTVIPNTRTLLNIITDNKPGTELLIRFWRNNSLKETRAKLAQRPQVES